MDKGINVVIDHSEEPSLQYAFDLVATKLEVTRLLAIIAELPCLYDGEYCDCPGYNGKGQPHTRPMPDILREAGTEDEYCEACEAKIKAGL